MKKTLSMLLLVLFVVGLFVSCNTDAMSNLFKDKIQEYTVTFDLQGHGSAIDPKTNIASGSTISAPPAPTADGFTFAGWYKEETLTNVWDFDNDTVTKDITLYAKWVETKTIADILPSEFPTDFDSSNWKNGINKVYISNQNLEFSQTGLEQKYEISTDKTVSLNGNAYTITDGNDTLSATLKFTMNDDELQSIEINFSGTTASSKETLKGTYSVPKTFKAVYNTNDTANTLTFYYDAVDHSGNNITVYDNLPTAATKAADWFYDEIRSNIKSVVIDESVKNYTGLTSTAYMFSNMREAESITGAEYLDVSSVKNMTCMFFCYGYNSTILTDVPNVSGWNTAKVENMTGLFHSYGYKSAALTVVPNVSGWNTAEVQKMGDVFNSYGHDSESLKDVPDVSGWNTAKVTTMIRLFDSYGYKSTALDKVPAVNGSNWNTSNVEDMQNMFNNYGHDSESLKAVPDVSNWKTDNVKKMNLLFTKYGYSSEELNSVPNVSNWNTLNVTEMNNIFENYGYSSKVLTCVPDVSNWETDNVTRMQSMFNSYGHKSNGLNFELDLSKWIVTNVTNCNTMFYNVGPISTWSVTIPATASLSENKKLWYVGDGNDINKYIEAPTGDYYFTLAGN